MFNDIYTIALTATSFEDLKKKLSGRYIDERKAGQPLITVTAQLALDGKIEIVNWMQALGASVDPIAYGYALAQNHEQVAACRDIYKASVDMIAQGYAQSGVHGFVGIYQRVFKANVNAICPRLCAGWI